MHFYIKATEKGAAILNNSLFLSDCFCCFDPPYLQQLYKLGWGQCWRICGTPVQGSPGRQDQIEAGHFCLGAGNMVGQFCCGRFEESRSIPASARRGYRADTGCGPPTSQHHHAYQCPQFHTFSFSQSLTHLLDKTRTVFLGLPVLGLQGIFNCI